MSSLGPESSIGFRVVARIQIVLRSRVVAVVPAVTTPEGWGISRQGPRRTIAVVGMGPPGRPFGGSARVGLDRGKDGADDRRACRGICAGVAGAASGASGA